MDDVNLYLDEEMDFCIFWFSMQKFFLVLYVSFGSFIIYGVLQLLELVLEFEVSGQFFLWILWFFDLLFVYEVIEVLILLVEYLFLGECFVLFVVSVEVLVLFVRLELKFDV